MTIDIDQVKKEVESSYGRCCLDPKFFDSFYEIFLASSSEIAPYFTKTDFSKQKLALKSGIASVVMFARGNAYGVLKIRDLGLSHSRSKLKVEPRLYKFWKESLIKAIAKSDSQFKPETEKLWKEVIDLAIREIGSLY